MRAGFGRPPSGAGAAAAPLLAGYCRSFRGARIVVRRHWRRGGGAGRVLLPETCAARDGTVLSVILRRIAVYRRAAFLAIWESQMWFGGLFAWISVRHRAAKSLRPSAFDFGVAFASGRSATSRAPGLRRISSRGSGSIARWGWVAPRWRAVDLQAWWRSGVDLRRQPR